MVGPWPGACNVPTAFTFPRLYWHACMVLHIKIKFRLSHASQKGPCKRGDASTAHHGLRLSQERLEWPTCVHYLTILFHFFPRLKTLPESGKAKVRSFRPFNTETEKDGVRCARPGLMVKSPAGELGG